MKLWALTIIIPSRERNEAVLIWGDKFQAYVDGEILTIVYSVTVNMILATSLLSRMLPLNFSFKGVSLVKERSGWGKGSPCIGVI